MSASSEPPASSARRCSASSSSGRSRSARCGPTRRPRSEGRALPFAGGEVTCEVLRDGCFDGLDLVIVDVDDPLALEWAPVAAAAGARVVDNSAAFRMESDVPLVVAEVNPEDLARPAARDRVVSQLHDDGARHRARAAAQGGRASTAWSSPPTSRSPAPGAPGITELEEQWSKFAGDTESLRRAGAIDGFVVAGRGVVEADRRQRDPARRFGEGGRLHERGVEARVREPQDPRTTTRCASPPPACACRCSSATRCAPTCSSATR